MNTNSFLNKGSFLAAALALSMGAHAALTDLSTLPLSTYYAPSSVDVKPNILFVLDDSGSMDWDAMPDQATWFENYNSEYRPGNYANVDNYMPPYMRYNSAFNGVAYNPATLYLPPVNYNADGTLNTATYPSMTSANTAAWTAVKNDGYGVQSTNTSDLSGGVYAFVTVPGEYCDKPDLRTCTTQTAPSATYPYAALMRWCATACLDTRTAGPLGIRRGSIRGCPPRVSQRLPSATTPARQMSPALRSTASNSWVLTLVRCSVTTWRLRSAIASTTVPIAWRPRSAGRWATGQRATTAPLPSTPRAPRPEPRLS